MLLSVKVSTGKIISPLLKIKTPEQKQNDVFLFSDRKQAPASVNELVRNGYSFQTRQIVKQASID